jgi:DNA primase
LKRGLTRKEIKAWELGYDPDKKRATFPIRSIDGHLVAVYGRALLEHQVPKYWMYSHLSAEITSYFYGEHLLDLTFSLPTGIILTEGPMDCIKMHRVTQNVLALCGTNVTEERLQRLKEWRQPVTLCLDNDPAGISAMEKIAKKINKVVPNVYRIVLPQGKDPWDCTEDELRAAVKTKSLFLS